MELGGNNAGTVKVEVGGDLNEGNEKGEDSA
jgi:hypothetical protein